ncbi:hypothetical protein [Cohnella sp.]|uniref:hypothetical protein n=1 Tax=Cohnella sp. TaxID=1883426 RepID=UPI003703C9E6
MEELYKILMELQPSYDFVGKEGVIEEGTLDSFDLISLVTMIEEKYEVIIDALDIVPANFSSVESIAELIRNSGGMI